MKSHEELIEQHERLLEICERVKERLLGYPNVMDVGVGVKETDGKLTDEGCIKVVVRVKKGEEDLSPEAVVPSEVEGVKTDVIVHDDKVLQAVCASDSEDYRPIRGGSRINNVRNGASSGGSGTLGCLAQRADGTWVILSNHHVLYGAKGKDGDEIGQPWVGCCCCCKTNIIAKNVDKDAALDCAIAEVEDDIAITNDILEVGTIQGSGAAAPVSGQRVRKRGARTGFTSGTISAIVSGQVEVTPKAAGGPAADPGGCTNFEAGVTVFTNPGDSGSVYVNDANEVVALHFGGGLTNNKSYGWDILRVQTALSITIKTTISAPGLVPSALSLEQLPDAVRIAPEDEWVRDVDARLNETAAGREIRAVIASHREEVLRLVNHNRAVTVTWHRKQGPAFVAAFGRSVKRSEYRIPDAINRVSLPNLLMSMGSILEEHGGEALKKDIEKYAPDILHASRHCASAEDLHSLIAQLDEKALVPSHSD